VGIAVVAEKPSVARDLARVLGANVRGEGYLHGNGYVVTWAIGHLVGLAQPHEIAPEWRRWRMETLPMLPSRWPWVVLEETKAQFAVVRAILRSPKIEKVIAATDAGREGELIFRSIYEACGSTKPVQRLWISSLTPEAISDGFRRLRDARELDGLADAARGRSRADWLVGMNLSRAYGLICGEEISVGRVQTPTLAMVVERERAIREFVPEDYFEVVATFEGPYSGVWFRDPENRRDSRRLAADGAEAEAIVARVKGGAATVESVEPERHRMAPPLLYDLTELQRHANRLYGMSAQRTLDAAQALYETHKLISYPRTDSRHLSTEVARTLPSVVAAIAPRYPGLVAPGSGGRALGRRFVDDARVTDHHAIIPTTTRAPEGLRGDEARLYDLVCRRLLAAWHADYVWSTTEVVTAVRSGEDVDRFHSTGSVIEELGWKVLDIKSSPSKGAEEEALPSGLAPGLARAVLEAEAVAKRTRPPPRFTDATLLTAMETAGRLLDDKELSDAMRATGLGTPATRAAIIETLLKRGYIVRDGKSLQATDKGMRLIALVHPDVKSPAMTGEWEAQLARIHRGEARLDAFMAGIERYVTDVIGKVKGMSPPPAPTIERPGPERPERPARPSDPRALLREAFGFEDFRPHQEPVCRAAIEGRDVLLVMPTGAGKSLCYQLPGLARGGTTLVVSPLIALIEDQVEKLRARGIAADRIHSGRDRAASRQAAADYLAGRLDFLFVAPERLRLPGFQSILERRKPTLVAVDEAHCISAWGHDFRPDYRMLGERLPRLRPAPIIALTATATPVVQEDIVTQLGLPNAARFIHGFRRHNLGIELVEIAPSARVDAARALLSDGARRPAIVYAPTRKTAEETARELSSGRGGLRAAVYHAGLEASARERVQAAFLGGELDVIVATIAFGMGVDKPDVRTVLHLALPSSIESYYQEIGRAGRDGKPARAVLMHSFVDRKTHEFFLEKGYPDPAVLARVYKALRDEPEPKDVVRRRARVAAEDFERALEKLWIHRGAVVEGAEGDRVRRGAPGWEAPYRAQRRHKEAELGEMTRFAQGHDCRMRTLVRHFGDQEDDGAPCGQCDACAPASCVARRFREPSPREQAALTTILRALDRSDGGIATGRLHREHFDEKTLDRKSFEHLLGALVRAGLVAIEEAEFERDGEWISFQRAVLTDTGRKASATSLGDLAVHDSVAAAAAAGKRTKKKSDAARRAYFAKRNARGRHRGRR
jgi:DNA topoisomerase-3